MSEYLFIYGTLRPGLAPGEVARAVEKLRAVDEGSVRGVLYDLGEYPGAVADEASQSRIFGTVFELPEDAGVLRALDGYEGFNPDVVSESLFVRVKRPVLLANGRVMECWIYIYNLDPVGVPVLADGRYRKRTAS